MADPFTLLIYGLAGIGALSTLSTLVNAIFGHTSTSSADPLGELLSIMQMQMMIPMLQSIMSAFQPKGPDLGGILMLIAPVIGIVLVLVLMKKFR